MTSNLPVRDEILMKCYRVRGPQEKTTRLNSLYNYSKLLKVLAGPQSLSQIRSVLSKVAEGRILKGETTGRSRVSVQANQGLFCSAKLG